MLFQAHTIICFVYKCFTCNALLLASVQNWFLILLSPSAGSSVTPLHVGAHYDLAILWNETAAQDVAGSPPVCLHTTCKLAYYVKYMYLLYDA